MLRWRLLLGTLFIAILVALCWLDAHAARPGIYLFPLAMILALAACGEILSLSRSRELRPLPWVVYGGMILMVASNLAGHYWNAEPLGTFGWLAAALATGLVLAFVGEMQRYSAPGGVTVRLAVAVLALTYVGLLISFAMQLRFVGEGRLGIAALASLVIVVKMGDIGAYTIGRLFGRHRMAPILSPGKTIEGACGGLLFALAGSAITFRVLIPNMHPGTSSQAPWWGWIAFALLVGTAGIMGDLAESMLKRDMGRKDSSRWLPGFGGVLDILDSVLLAAPVAYLCWVFELVGP